jgi:hypothetical protein
MKNIFIIIAGIMIYSCSYNKKPDYWFRECDSTGIKCRYIDTHGNVKIPYGKYYHCYTDTFKNIAFVTGEKGIIGINKNEEILFNVCIFDNGPDYIVDGTFRIVDKNKMGFADTLGKIIIPAIYDFVYPFEKNIALVNIGGHSESIDPSDPQCEYHTWVGGNWGIINKKGEIIKDIKYDLKGQKGKNILINNSEILELENGTLKKIE